MAITSPGTFDYFLRGEPPRTLYGTANNQGADLYRAGQTLPALSAQPATILTVPATIAIAEARIRTVPATIELVGTERVVASVTFELARERSVPATFALIAPTGVRTVPASVELSAIASATRTVTASIELSGPSIRTVANVTISLVKSTNAVAVWGRLLDVQATPLAAHTLTFQPDLPRNVAFTDAFRNLIWPGPVTVTTRADGSFTTAALPTDTNNPRGVALRVALPYSAPLWVHVGSADSPLLATTPAADPGENGWSTPATCLVSGTVIDASNQPVAGTTLQFAFDVPQGAVLAATGGSIVVNRPVSVVTDSQGQFTVRLIRAAALTPVGVRAKVEGAVNARFTVPDAAGANLFTLV
jgi:hypothetical protein